MSTGLRTGSCEMAVFSCPLSDVHKSKGSSPQIRILTNGVPHNSSVISLPVGEYTSNHSKSLHGKSAFNFVDLERLGSDQVSLTR